MSDAPLALPPEEPQPAATDPTPVAADPLSAMTPRFNLFFRWFARRFFGHFQLDDATVARLRELEQRGAVVYVMRYSSRLDYFLFNWLFQLHGLRLSSFANGLRFYYYRPVWEALRAALGRPRGRPREVAHSEDCEHVRDVVRAGGSAFLFLRTARFRSFVRGRSRRMRRDELDLLQEVVKSFWSDARSASSADAGVAQPEATAQGEAVETPISLVPLSVFWRKGPRSESRFLNLSYGALTRPSDFLKVSSFLATYRSLAVKCGESIDLSGFIAERRDEGAARLARKVRRSILTYLYREEKVVEGPTLRARHRVREVVLETPRVQAAIRDRARTRRRSLERATLDAEKMFGEIAAHQNSTFLAVLAVVASWIFRKLFTSIEVEGLDRVAEIAKRFPIVLVPSHRSYFDFLIVSWLFYTNYMVPPHIAARENMAFGPFGFLFRRAGAFFLRRSFDDPLYKEVFRAYVVYLVREGFPQEFFIEGGRSRTGKSLAPRLGMLSWDVEAFLDGSRRDLLFVPVAITYERLVEEGAMLDELEGAKKTEESVLGLVRARKVLQRRFGTVHVNFGAPLSLASEMGERRKTMSGEDEAAQSRRRQFVEHLGLHIVERINWDVVVNATSVAACVLLGSTHRGLLREELVERMQRLVDLLTLQGVRLTDALLADRGDFRESIAFLRGANLVKSLDDPRGEILYFEESRRRALDLYRNTIGHYLATPSLLARRVLSGASKKELQEDLVAWQELLYQEFYTPRNEALLERSDAILTHFEQRGWIEQEGERFVAREEGEAVLQFLREQTRGVVQAYRAACAVASDEALDVDRKEFMARAAEQFESDRLLGEADRPESANETTFQNALDLLLRWEILEARRPEPASERRGRRSTPPTRYSRGEGAHALRELRDRLDAGL